MSPGPESGTGSAQATESAHSMQSIVVKGAKAGSHREHLLLSYPIVIHFITLALMGVIDTIFMGWAEQAPPQLIDTTFAARDALGLGTSIGIMPVAGTAQQGGVSLASVLAWTLCSLFTGTLTVLNPFVSQNKGADKPDACSRYAWHGLYLSLPFAVPVTLLALWAPEFISLMRATPETQPHAAAYLAVRLYGSVTLFMLFAQVSFYRGTGDNITPMWVGILTNAANVLLNYLLIFGKWGFPAMGPAGAALATVLAQAVGIVVFLFIFLGPKRNRLFQSRRTWRPDFGVFKRICRVGFPIGGNWLLENGSWAMFTVLVSQMGEYELAAHAVALQLMHLSFLPGVAIMIGTTTLVGQYLGKGRPDIAERSANNALRMGLLYMGAVALIFVLTRGHLIELFNRDPNVVAIGSKILLVVASFQILDGAYLISIGALRGAGDTRWPFWITAISSWGVFVPSVHILGNVMGWGIFGAWCGVLLHTAVLSVALYTRFRRGRWKKMASLVEEPPLPSGADIRDRPELP